MIDEAIGINSGTDATRKAEANTLLSPRFYKTDYAALERFDAAPVRAEWDQLIGEFRRDVNRDHFERNAQFDAEVAALPADQKRALELAFFSGLTQQEIAQKLSEPLGTVKARIRRALLKLRDTLAHRL